ncbi:hypothetical protein F7234_00890 [Pseudomonas putida]|uniref:hypothetical protein n=1 Tax=Pseudomonas putida TaxID=303 RepID=UPI00125FBA78|nr:hypothetical protein [Pseudomonas putida]KAB5626969.1 hypothetical protein F7234_00890 [Pseudomonas putida]
MKLNSNGWTRTDLALPDDGSADHPPYLVDGFFYSSRAANDGHGAHTIVLTKLTQDGKVVGAFGEQGTARISMPGEAGSWLCFVTDRDYLVCGVALRGSLNFAIFRLHKDTGKMDMDFGHQGFELTPYPTEPIAASNITDMGIKVVEDHAGRVPQFHDGKLRQAANSGFAQFDLQGKLDTSFNEVGMRRYFKWEGSNLYTLAVNARFNGTEHAGFYYSGFHRVGGGDVQAWVGACDKNGAVVSGFAEQGVWIVKRLPGHPNLVHLAVYTAVQAHDRLYLVGGAAEKGFVLCLKLDGSPDQSFNKGEAIVFARDEFNSTLAIAAIPHDNGVLVSFVQNSQVSEQLPVAILRLDHKGEVDRTFGEQGWLLTPDYPPSTILRTLEYESQHVIEVRGDTFVARYPLQ